jgi:YidC/Oxa1 family membrane protein insertase
MISDWSGVATEYAYGREKPVLFIDLPPKVNNPAYRELGIEPLEAVVRKEIGELVDLEDLPKIPEIIEKLLMLETSKIQEIRKSREERVYNVGTSASISANYIELVADAADYGARQAIHNGTIEL